MDFKLQKFRIPLKVTRIANVHYFELTSRFSTKDDSHSFCELVYVDRGTLRVHSEHFSGDLSVNQLIIHRPDEVHSFSAVNAAAPNVIIIGFECACPELVPFSQNPVVLSAEQGRLLAQILQEAFQVYEPPYDIPNTTFMHKRAEYPFGADQMIKLYLETFLISLIRDFQPAGMISANRIPLKSGGIRTVHRYLTENFSSKITLDNLCFLFRTNKTTLCRQFREEYGSTIFGYINSLRIKEAKSMLRESKVSVTEIAERLGFESIHYFCRQFKRATGQSPTEYSRTIRAKLNL